MLGDTLYPWAGTVAQSAVSVLLVGLCFFLPSHQRITKLETSHRSFQIGMEDVAKAYAIAHAQDRSGVFKLSGEFDAVRERLTNERIKKLTRRYDADLRRNAYIDYRF